MTAPTKYGADITDKQMILLVVALCSGTLLEWYDFSVYSQMAGVIGELFFPKGNEAVKEMSFWAVFALGFVSRPIGAVLLGHVADAVGRRLGMLVCVVMIAVPTIIQGCLPTYEQAGIVAPILMAIFRFIQGLAVGGEFGSAVVYLYEMAPRNRKSLIASLGAMAIAPGIILGTLAVLAVDYACTQEQLLLWGWRLPFLFSAVITPVAIVLRKFLPEPKEFLESKHQLVNQRIASVAAHKVAAHPTTARTMPRLSSRQISGRLMSLQDQIDIEAAIQAATSDGSCVKLTIKEAAPATSGKDVTRATPAAAAAGVPAEVKQEFVAEVAHVAHSVKHHVPLLDLFRGYWRQTLLQICLEACYACCFYTFFSWLPSHLVAAKAMSVTSSLWMSLVSMVVFAGLVPLAGHLADLGAPKLWCFAGISLLLGAISAPVLMAADGGRALVVLWLVVPVCVGLTGLQAGWMTGIGPVIYAPGVRTTGYNVGHNLAFAVFGGCAPFIVSAMATGLKPASLAAGVFVAITAVITCIAAVLLNKVSPAANKPRVQEGEPAPDTSSKSPV